MNKCPICGKEYDDPVKMAECIMSCDKKRKEEEVLTKNKAAMAEKKASEDKIDALYTAYRNAIKEHIKNYGGYTATYKPDDFVNIFDTFNFVIPHFFS